MFGFSFVCAKSQVVVVSNLLLVLKDNLIIFYAANTNKRTGTI